MTTPAQEPMAPVAVVGLGYVGLQLATALGREVPTIGFDIDIRRVEELRKGHDRNGEQTSDEVLSPFLTFTSDPAALREARFVVVAVPTPVDAAKRPDLRPLEGASRTVGRNLSRGAVVVYESTVYPGCTERVCVPILEKESGLRRGVDFKVGYSPERINPGDREHTLDRVVKIVAGEDEATTEAMARIYGRVAKAGVHRAPDIATAEAAKAIENVQRDLNIALMNELAVLFHRLGLDTREVLRAAGTKWNFLRFEPGLVGGHCIPVDPYYLTHCAQEHGYHPEVILAGRRINDAIPGFVAYETVKLLNRAGKSVRDARVLLLGYAFKENVPDVRNTGVAAIVRELEETGAIVDVHDPLVEVPTLREEVARAVADPWDAERRYDAVVLAVAHARFRERPAADYVRLFDRDGPPVLVDVKGVLDRDALPNDAFYWRL